MEARKDERLDLQAPWGLRWDSGLPGAVCLAQEAEDRRGKHHCILPFSHRNQPAQAS